MRIGAMWDYNSAANYRAISPLEALAQRGHQVLMPPERGVLPDSQLATCDAVIVYRRFDPRTRATMRRLKEARVAVIWDNDDDFLHMPQTRKLRRDTGGRNNRQIFADVLKAATIAHVVTTTTEPLAEVLRGAGLPDVRVIDNYLTLDPRVPRRGRGLTVGWIAGLEHRADAISLGLPQILRQLQERHPELEVTSVGVDLGLRERYRHASFVPWPRLVEVMADFDIGIAPLVDTQFNRARSSIKVKEYAASGVPWLASRIAPYANLDEHNGGRLVNDDGWYAAIDDLVEDAEARARLSRAGSVWARHQTIAATISEYESLLAQLIGHVSGKAATMTMLPAAATPIDGWTRGGERFAVRIPRGLIGRKAASR